MFSIVLSRLVWPLLAILVLASACGVATAETPEPAHTKVSIANFAFVPQEIAIAPGDAVTWSNDDGSPHAVTFADSRDGAKLLLPGEKFTRMFDQPGSYEYFCSFHTFMTGRVVVRLPSPHS